jgi:hypothetical protein
MTGSGKNFVNLGQITGSSILSLGLKSSSGLLLLEEDFSLGTTLILKALDKLLVLPSNIIGEVTHLGVLTSRLEADNTKSSRDDLTLHLVVGVGDSLEGGETSNGGLSTGSLLVNHTTDSPPNHTGRGLEVEGTTSRVGVHALGAELSVLGLVTDERSRDNHILATDKNNLLSSQEFLGNDGAQTTVEVVAAVNDDGLFENHFYCVMKDESNEMGGENDIGFINLPFEDETADLSSIPT